MTTKCKIEVFSAGCPGNDDVVKLVESIACPSCEVEVLDMNDSNVVGRVQDLGIRSVPAVVINGKLADCCMGRGPDEGTLRSAGLGQPISELLEKAVLQNKIGMNTDEVKHLHDCRFAGGVFACRLQ